MWSLLAGLKGYEKQHGVNKSYHSILLNSLVKILKYLSWLFIYFLKIIQSTVANNYVMAAGTFWVGCY